MITYEDLYTRIFDAIEAASDERDLSFDARAWVHDDSITIDTRISRDPNRSRNGGEYSYWLKVWTHRDNVLVQDFCSCDFWQPQDEPDLVRDLLWSQVEKIVKDLADMLHVPVAA